MAPAIRQPPLLSQSQPATLYQQLCSRQVKRQDWESPLTPWPPSLLPLPAGTLMNVGDRLPEAEMMAISLPAIPEEDERFPLSGRPISRCLARRVDALYPPPQALLRH